MTIAIIDGDVLAYHACESRWDSKLKDGMKLIELDSEGKRIPWEFTKEEDRYYLEKSWENFQKKLFELLDTVFCTEYLMAVKGEDNFRNLIFPGYKMNRHKDPTKQNKFVPTIRKLAVHQDLAIAADGFEADDLLRMWAEECRAYNIEYVVCSIDKDLKCIPGNHYFMHHKKFEMISEAEAIKHYYCQLLKGDPTDNVLGVPRVGEVKAARILDACSCEEEFQEAVVEQYMNAYGDLWYDQLLINGRMIHIMRNANDYFDPKEWPVAREMRKEQLETQREVKKTEPGWVELAQVARDNNEI